MVSSAQEGGVISSFCRAHWYVTPSEGFIAVVGWPAPMASIEMYTTSWCPYCVRAKSLLAKKGQSVQEINIEEVDGARDEMVQRSGGRMTVPQIFIDGEHVGGSDDLYALDAAGGLDKLLAN